MSLILHFIHNKFTNISIKYLYNPSRAHPHKLVGKDMCSQGVCTLKLNNETMTATFANLGIQCVKKKDIDESMRERERIRVDPFRST